MMSYILVVDDDPTIREFVTLALEDEGYATQTAQDGAVALNLADQATPDLILLDMRMPVMNGWEFVEAYRNPGKTADPREATDESEVPLAPIVPGSLADDPPRPAEPRQAPIIIMTAATDASAFAREIKADAYLAKPFDIEQLLKLVEQFVKPVE